MRMLVTLFAALISFPLTAQQRRIEYGKPAELSNAKNIFIIATGNEDLAKEARRQLSERLPMLAFAESEDKGDVTLVFGRKPAESDPKQLATTMYAARATGAMTIRLYVDAVSTKEDLSEAVGEVVARAVNLFQKANPQRFGAPPPEEDRSRTKAMVHSTAGLRPGLSQRDVLSALGSPTNVIGRGYTQTWVYKTGDGDIRLVFGGDRLMSVTIPEKK